MKLPQFIVQFIVNHSGSLGAVLDKLEELHFRQERETRKQRGNSAWPPFDRVAVRSELIARFPHLVQRARRHSPSYHQPFQELKTPVQLAVEKVAKANL